MPNNGSKLKSIFRDFGIKKGWMARKMKPAVQIQTITRWCNGGKPSGPHETAHRTQLSLWSAGFGDKYHLKINDWDAE